MKDYYENKIAHLEEQIEATRERIESCYFLINIHQDALKELEEREKICGREILKKSFKCESLDDFIERQHKDIEYYHCQIRSHRREIIALEKEIENVQRQQRNQYKTKCSADEGYDELDIMLIIGRNGFIGGTRL